MSKKWVLLVGAIFAVHLAPTTTLNKRSDPVGGGDLSLQGLVPISGRPDTIHSNEKITDATAILASDTGSKSKIMLPQTRERRAATITDADNTSPSLLGSILAAPFNLIKSILYAPLSIVEAMMNRVKEMFGNLTEMMMIKGWEISKNFIIPKLDEYLMKMTTVEMVPDDLKRMIISAHSTYSILKLFGIMRPA